MNQLTEDLWEHSKMSILNEINYVFNLAVAALSKLGQSINHFSGVKERASLLSTSGSRYIDFKNKWISILF
jgi:hypothetical protein